MIAGHPALVRSDPFAVAVVPLHAVGLPLSGFRHRRYLLCSELTEARAAVTPREG